MAVPADELEPAEGHRSETGAGLGAQLPREYESLPGREITRGPEGVTESEPVELTEVSLELVPVLVD